MRFWSFVFLLLCASVASATTTRVQLSAPTYAGQRALIYRYLDLFTGRTELLAHTRLDDRGNALLEADITGTTKCSIRIGEVTGDLWSRGGSYTITFPAPDPRRARSLNGTTQVDPIFTNLDPLDINALMTDLNERLDAFLSENLATDQQKGMQAIDSARHSAAGQRPDSTHRPGTLYITPDFTTAQVDTFERKLRRFYGEVKDPWFWQNLDYGIAGLRFGPRVNDRALFEKYLKDKPVLYDVPEYVRFIGSFFDQHLLRFPFRSDEAALGRHVNAARLDSVTVLFAKHDFLKDPRLCELIVLQELYAQYPGKLFDRAAIRTILMRAANASTYPEHKRIAANMLWDLTTMRTGGTLPSLVLRNVQGEAVRLDTLLHDATCLVVTASWCTYCEQELVALDALLKEYGPYIQVIGIGLDRDVDALAAYVKAHPQRAWPWLHGGDDPTIMDVLRLHSVPAFFLLNGDTLAWSPAPAPSNGMAAILHRMKVEADERNKLRPDDGQHAPRQR